MVAYGVSCPGLGVVETGTPAPMTWKQRFTGQPQAGEKHLERGRFSTVPVLQQPCKLQEKAGFESSEGFYDVSSQLWVELTCISHV